MVGLTPEQETRLSEDAGDRTIPSFPPAHLCHIYFDVVDSAHLDTRPADCCCHAYSVLPYRAALQGGALPAHTWSGFRRILQARPLLAALAATGFPCTVYGTGDAGCEMI